jgi:hypothetical protein
MFGRLAVMALAIGLFLGGASAIAADAGGVEAQTVIKRQLEAFQRGDANAAFALASPGMKETYSDPAKFMASVRSGETPFFNRRMTEFNSFAAQGDSAAQRVTLIDDASGVWNAIFKLTRQPDGTWLIDGVLLIKSDATDA